MQANGQLSPSLNPKTLSLAILTALQGGLLLAKLRRSSIAMGAALDEIIRLVEQESVRSLPRDDGQIRAPNQSAS